MEAVRFNVQSAIASPESYFLYFLMYHFNHF